MKNLFKITLGFSLFFLLATPCTLSAKEKSDSLYTIEIDGKVLLPKRDESKLYKIELLYHNTVVDSGLVDDSESFLLKIKKDAWYTIRIIKAGYYPLVVSIDTRLPENNSSLHKFHFDTELISKATQVSDDEAIDFPIAIISYNSRKNSFLPVMEYSKNIKSSLFDVQPVKEGYAIK